MGYPKYLLMLTPFTRAELPGWINVLQLLGAFKLTGWEQAPTKRLRGKRHGYEMVLDLRHVSDRFVYFAGRYLEVELPEVVERLLQPGDTFLDVGANTGMLTLVGARAVGASGLVHSFEPNPAVFARLKGNVDANRELAGIVTLHHAGLSDAAGELTLHVPVDAPEMGTFGSKLMEVHKDLQMKEIRCPVLAADEVLAGLPSKPTVCKIDVEGFECGVLRGMQRTIERLKPAILTEVEPELLAGAGSSATELEAMLKALGYHGYWISGWQTKPKSFLHRSFVEPIRGIGDHRSSNVLWLQPGSVHDRRIAGMVKK